jgi:exodeoxyribonuclease-3
VVSVYVPNGRVPGSDHYDYKLAWLASLRDMVAAGPDATVVCGDMNIAPTDDDVFDPDAYVGHTHVTAPERAALAELTALGLHDVVRERWPHERVFTYWDYRAGMFHQDLGMRIDLASVPMRKRLGQGVTGPTACSSANPRRLSQVDHRMGGEAGTVAAHNLAAVSLWARI